MAGFSVNFNYKSNGAEIAQNDATALADLADQLDKVAGTASASSAGMSDDFSAMSAKLRDLADQAKDVPMALQNIGGGPIVEQISGVSKAAEEMGDDVEDATRRGSAGSEVLRGSMQNLGYSALGASQLMEGPSGIIEAIGQFLAFGGQTLDVVPGIGLALGSLATVGGLALTVLGGKMGDTKTDAQELSTSITDLFQDFVTNQSQTLTEAQQNQAIFNVINTQSADAAKLASASNVTMAEAVRALAGDQSAQKEVQDGLNGSLKTYESTQYAVANGDKAASDNTSKVLDAQKLLNSATDGYTSAASKASLYAEATGTVSKTADTASKSVKTLGNTIDALPTNKHIAVDLDIDDSTLNARLAALGKKYSVTIPVHVDTSRVAGEIQSTVIANSGKTITLNGKVFGSTS